MTWPCEAYGPDGLEHGAVCFVGVPDRRECESAEQCHAAVTRCRQATFSRMSELAAAGDPVGLLLAEDFTSPDQLFNAAADVGDPD